MAVAFASHSGLRRLQHLVHETVSDATLVNIAAIFNKLSSPTLAVEVVAGMVEFNSFPLVLRLCTCPAPLARNSAVQTLDNFASLGSRRVNGVPVADVLVGAGAMDVCVKCLMVDAASSPATVTPTCLSQRVHAVQALGKLAEVSASARELLIKQGRLESMLSLGFSGTPLLQLAVARTLYRLVGDASMHQPVLQGISASLIPVLLVSDDHRIALSAARALNLLTLNPGTQDALETAGIALPLLRLVGSNPAAYPSGAVPDDVLTASPGHIKHTDVLTVVLTAIEFMCGYVRGRCCCVAPPVCVCGAVAHACVLCTSPPNDVCMLPC